MARLLLITNPAAARTSPATVREVEAVMRRLGWQVDAVATAGPGDARALAAAGVADRMDVVAVFGGDGTTMQAASALVGTEVPLGLIPGGTGNILAGNLRLPARPVQAAEAIARGRPRALDLGRVERLDGVHYFAVAAGAGLDARIMMETGAAQKRRWGIGAYFSTLFRVLPGVRSVPVVLTIDGEEIRTDAAMVMISNCGEVIPPHLRFRSDTSPFDGLLDVTVARTDSLWDSLRVVREALRPLAEQHADPARLSFARGTEITVVPAETLPVQLDGDGAGETPLTARVVPGAIRVMLADR